MSKNKVVIGKSVLNEEAINEFIERMKAHGYSINTRPLSEAEWLKICEEHGVNPCIRSDTK